MDAPASIVSLPSPAGRPPLPGSAATSLPPVATPASSSGATRVTVERDRVVVERLVLIDAGLAAFVAERPGEERAGLVERALKIGMTALMDAGVTVNVDAVRAEFATLLRATEDANAKAATALDQLLRQNFADGDGRLPRTLEAFLGDRGKLRSLTDELFDESKRDSAIGRIRTLLGTYLEGDGSKLATLLDPTRLGSPLFQFRGEMTEGFAKLNERIAALEAASSARAQERAKGTAKGGDFEATLEPLLADVARGAGDTLDVTATETGAVIGSKKGDFVLTLNPDLTGGAEVRVVVEAKDRAMSGRAMREELREAKTNRGAAIGLVVFTPAHAPAGIAPFDVRAGDVYCVVDPELPDGSVLEAAVRLARLLALATLREHEVEINAEAVRAALTGIREQLEAVRTLKATLTSVQTSLKDVHAGLDRLREGVLARVAEAEGELRAAAAG
ncbi:MAG TPA: hypothetical protein VLM76_14540 [Patescibacteria group bacterium]|nr:hypothetical protein [Patescibacteria group bacterium]